MGNSSSNERQDDNQLEPQRREKLQGSELIRNLPKIFGQHYNHVVGFTDSTRAQQKLVDRLSAIPKAEHEELGKFQSEVMTAGLDILKDIQSVRYRQTTSLYESLMELYHNIQGIFEYCGLQKFPVESPHPDEHSATGKVASGNQAPDVQDQIDALEKKISKKDKRLAELESIYRKTALENVSLKGEIKRINTLLKQYAGTNDFLNQKVYDLQEVILKLQPPKLSATVQLFHSHSGNTIKDIEAALKALLKNHLNSVDFIKCNTLNDIDPSKILIVPSIITSRVGTDAANAIKDIENPAKTVLLLFHIKESHALSKQASTSVLTGQTFKALGGIYDMAFVIGKGIYPCEMNDIALSEICTFIKQNMAK